MRNNIEVVTCKTCGAPSPEQALANFDKREAFTCGYCGVVNIVSGVNTESRGFPEAAVNNEKERYVPCVELTGSESERLGFRYSGEGFQRAVDLACQEVDASDIRTIVIMPERDIPGLDGVKGNLDMGQVGMKACPRSWLHFAEQTNRPELRRIAMQLEKNGELRIATLEGGKYLLHDRKSDKYARLDLNYMLIPSDHDGKPYRSNEVNPESWLGMTASVWNAVRTEMSVDRNDGRERDNKFLTTVGVAGAIGIVALMAHSGADVIGHTLIQDVRVAGANLGVNPDTAEASVRGLMVGLQCLRNIALFALLPSILNVSMNVDTDKKR